MGLEDLGVPRNLGQVPRTRIRVFWGVYWVSPVVWKLCMETAI